MDVNDILLILLLSWKFWETWWKLNCYEIDNN